MSAVMARLPSTISLRRRGGIPMALNCHTHYHSRILDGLFEPREDGQIRFLRASVLTAAEIAGIGEQVGRRVLRWFARSGLLAADDARDMLGWDNGGFSLDASARIAEHDRAGLSVVSERAGGDPWILLVPRYQQSIPRRLEWGTGVSTRFRLPGLNVRYLESTLERLSRLEGLQLADCGPWPAGA